MEVIILDNTGPLTPDCMVHLYLQIPSCHWTHWKLGDSYRGRAWIGGGS